jgi:hypothetical protein
MDMGRPKEVVSSMSKTSEEAKEYFTGLIANACPFGIPF